MGRFFVVFCYFCKKQPDTCDFFVRNVQLADTECGLTAIAQPTLGVAPGDAHAQRLSGAHLQPEDKGS